MLSFLDIAKIFEEIELKLIASLKRNLSRHKAWEKEEGFKWSAWQAEKLKNMERFRRENQSVLGEYTDVIDRETRTLMQEEFKEGEELVNSQFEELKEEMPEATKSDLVTSDNFFGVNQNKMDALMNDITQLEKDVSYAALRMTDDIYRQTLNKVQLSMGTGSTSLQEAIDNAVKDFHDKGINCIEYKDGRRVNIADYVRMALRTTSTRAALQGEAKRRTELGYDTVLVSQYSACSDTCLPWQGRVYIDDVFTVWEGEINGDIGKSNYCGKWFTLLSVAIRAGLFHPNCRHTMTTWIDGVSSKPKPLDISKVRENAKLEAKQRRLENKIRQAKRRVLGYSDPRNIKQAKSDIKEAQRELREFVGEHSDVLKRDYNREKVDPREVDKTLDKQGENDIIKAEDVKPLEQAKKRDHKILITETSIDKVAEVKVKGFTESQNEHLISKHKELLEVAKNKNNSNEVLKICDMDFMSDVTVLGDEFGVNPNNNPFAVSVVGNAKPNSLAFLHNHPSTNNFSIADIDTFIGNKNIGLMSVVTNQGEVYVMHKNKKYSYHKSRSILTSALYTLKEQDKYSDDNLVNMFLKESYKGGIDYAKSK